MGLVSQSYGTVVSFLSFLVMAPLTISRKPRLWNTMKETFLDIADKRVVQAAFIAPGLPSSKSFNFFVQVPPNGPLNITCQKTQSPKKSRSTRTGFYYFSEKLCTSFQMYSF